MVLFLFLDRSHESSFWKTLSGRIIAFDVFDSWSLFLFRVARQGKMAVLSAFFLFHHPRDSGEDSVPLSWPTIALSCLAEIQEQASAAIFDLAVRLSGGGPGCCVVYPRASNLFAVRFDVRNLAVRHR